MTHSAVDFSVRDAGSYRLTFAGAKETGDIRGMNRLPGLSNHLTGPDTSRWRLNVPQFAGVESQDVYAGIDVRYRGDGGLIECDFYLAPHADPRRIRMRLDGASQIHLTPKGDLAFLVGGAGLEYRRPRAFQERGGVRVPVEVSYRLQANGLTRFSLGKYDHNLPLVIDPVLSFTESFGGSADQYGRGVAVDGSGNVYVVGYTASANFPTRNPFQAHNGSSFAPYGTAYDVFVTKLNSAGAIVYSTYLGGSADDMGYAIAVDSGGNAYITGLTSSSDFPLANPLQASYSGTAKAFITKLNAAGNALIYSTFLGGSSSESGGAIAIDSDGNAYVAGDTSSADFPTTKNAYLSSAPGMGDVFVSKLDPAGASLVFSTYLGGSAFDQPNSIALDAGRNVYLTGETYSSDFPLLNAAQTTPPLDGQSAAFVSKFDATGQTLLYSTYLGVEASGAGIVADGAGNAYVTGTTDSVFPLLNPIQGTSNNHTCFVTKLTAAGAIAFSTGYGTGFTSCTGIALDNVGRIVVVGDVNGIANFPLVDPIQIFPPTGLVQQSGFVAMFDSEATQILFSSILGLGSFTSQVDVNAIAADTSGNVFTAGEIFWGQVIVKKVNLTSSCSYAVSPTTYPTPIPVDGGSGAITVTAPAGCVWNAIGLDLVGPTLVSGNGTVTFQLPSGMGPDQTFNFIVAGQKVTVTQLGYGCSYQITGSNPAVIPMAGGSGQFNVTAGGGCPLFATTTDDWITIGYQDGSGWPITFTVAANTSGQDRQGTISVGGLTYTITQDALPWFELRLQAAPAVAGSIAVSPPSASGTWLAGTRVCLSANANTGWAFNSWSGDPLDSSACLVMDANHSATANFGATTAMFNDVPPSATYFDAANLMFQAGVTTGCVPGNSAVTRSYCPDNNITRQEMAAFIVRAVTGTTTPAIYNTTPYFQDVPASSQFFAHIQKLMDLGITTGCSQSPALFCPTDTMPRWQMAMFMVRARLALYGAAFSSAAAPYFADAPTNVEGNGQPFPFIQRAYEEHVTNGCGSNPLVFCPDGVVTRGQMASFIMRALFNETTIPGPTAPQLTGVSPNTLPASPGSQITVTITGANTSFQTGDTVTVPSGMLAVSNVVVNSATSITATLATNGNAVAGPQALVATSGGQNLTLPLALRVGTY
ncbi:MAG: SBBP repeat-containing protein [Bryobacteraceae bacterium]